jgi:hypothetical protein
MVKREVLQKLTEDRNYFKPFNYPWAYDALVETRTITLVTH